MREYFFSKGLIVPQAEKNQNLCAFIGLEWKALNLLGFVIELVWRLRFFFYCCVFCEKHLDYTSISNGDIIILSTRN